MSYLTLEQLTKPKRIIEDVEIEELGGTIRIAQLSAAKALEFKNIETQKARGSSEDLERKQFVLLLSSAIVDEHGQPMLNEKTAGQFINSVPFNTLNAVIARILKLAIPSDEKKEGEAKETDAGN